MSSSYERKYNSFIEIVEMMTEKAEEGTPIIVEGKKDLAALKKMGINGKTICIKNSSGFFVDILDNITSKEVMVFVDFDKNGILLVKKMANFFTNKNVKINLIFWKKMRALIRRDVKDVEGLPSYFEKLKSQIIQKDNLRFFQIDS